MKKKTLFKILTLFLTFVIFSCCSGCLTLYFNHKKLQEALEIQKQKKASADALVPEIEGYTFEARPTSYFSSREDWESQGFLRYDDFVDENKGYEYELIFTNLADGSIKITIRHFLEEGGNYIIIPTEQEEKYGTVFPGGYRYLACNEEGFIMIEMEEVFCGSFKSSKGGIGVFLVDFEKHEMYYVGYSKGWIEAELNDNKLYSYINICFKLAKDKGE